MQSEKYARAIASIYDEAVNEFARIGKDLRPSPSKLFSFNDYPAAKRKADEILNGMAGKMKAKIIEGTEKNWLFASAKNDAFLSSIMDTSKVSKRLLNKYQNRNIEALHSFQKRKVGGLDLSGRVWNYAGQMKKQMEFGLDIAIGEGRSAKELATDLKKYLAEPDKLFRRVRDKHGNLVLSRNAANYHPGQGVYRSSYRNALRLTRTEINMAYRESDQLRWQQLDFVIGYEVKRSNNEYDCDVCGSLAGQYPKDFKFVGWHPQCYDELSEVLTRRGWQYFKDVKETDSIFSLNPETRVPEWVGIDMVFSRDYKGQMVRFSNRSLDCLVTPDHEMLYLKKSDGSIARRTADEYTKGMGAFYRGCDWTGEERESITIGGQTFGFDAFAEFMGYWLSDGSLIRDYQIKIAQQAGDQNRPNIERCIERMGLKAGGTSQSVDCYSKDLNRYLKAFGKAVDKHVPEVIKTASKRQIQIFLDAFISCDGHIKKAKPFVGSRGTLCTPRNNERTYYTTSKQMASDIGELILKIGKRPSFRVDKVAGKEHQFRNGTYTINNDSIVISECNALTSTVFDKSYEEYDGTVYDVTLERNAIMYIRRNGKCFWGSNCRCHAIPILQDPDTFDTDELDELKAAINGTEYERNVSGKITDVPDGFKMWVTDNKERAKGWKSQPLFIRNNFNNGRIDGGLKLSAQAK